MNLANRWNVLRYSLYTPIYDLIAGIFSKHRKKSIAQLELKAEAKVLLIGAGTGLDLAYLPSHWQITATDITPAMLSVLRFRARNNKNIEVFCMDGQQLALPDNSYDAVILHLILAVIPDPVACLREAERVLKPQGQIILFDKFLSEESQPSPARRLFGKLTNLLFSDINRKFSAILATTRLELVHNKPAALKGTFRYILLRKS